MSNISPSFRTRVRPTPRPAYLPAALPHLLAVIAALCGLFCGKPASAQAALPDVVKPPAGINLGSTSFYDGFGRIKPGVTLLQYFRWTHDTEIANDAGKENLLFSAPSLNIFPALTQTIVTSKWHPFGGTGVSVLVPIVDLNSDFAATSPKKLSSNGVGIGDVIAGPIFQSKYFVHDPAQGDRNSYLAFRAQFLVQFPTGKFAPGKSLNPGTGYWAVAPYLSATWLPVSRLEMSTRFHYQYNLATQRIPAPPPIPGLVYKSGQAGQLLYDNLTASWKFTRKLYLGGNAYGVYQLTPDRTNGIRVAKARETQLYLGPGGGYDFSKKDTLNVNLYLKVEAHNAAAGPALQLLYIHRF
jgi:hypothetical protein